MNWPDSWPSKRRVRAGIGLFLVAAFCGVFGTFLGDLQVLLFIAGLGSCAAAFLTTAPIDSDPPLHIMIFEPLGIYSLGYALGFFGWLWLGLPTPEMLS